MAIYEKKNAHAKNAQKSGGGGYRLVPIKDKNPKVDPNKLVPIKSVSEDEIKARKAKETKKKNAIKSVGRAIGSAVGAVSGVANKGTGKKVTKKPTYSGTNTSRTPGNTKKKIY